MKRILLYAGVPVLLAAIAILTVVPDAQSAIYETPYYNINYFGISQYIWARRLAPYLNRAFWAARTVIGRDARFGKINIYFKYFNNGEEGWTYTGEQNLFLNRRYFKSYDTWGSVAAHESTHILFSNETRDNTWARSLPNHHTFLTESLAWYAGDYVYNFRKYTSSSAFNEIRSNLRNYTNRTRLYLAWTRAGYYYTNGSGDRLNQAIWQLKAIGYYLTGGRLTSSSRLLRSTLSKMNELAKHEGRGLRRDGFGTRRFWFEYAFQWGYRKMANADWVWTGSANGAYKSVDYLYGQFWNLFYN